MTRKLHADTVRLLLRYHRNGYSVSDLAESFGLTRQTVSRVVNRRTHKRVIDNTKLDPLTEIQRDTAPKTAFGEPVLTTLQKAKRAREAQEQRERERQRARTARAKAAVVESTPSPTPIDEPVAESPDTPIDEPVAESPDTHTAEAESEDTPIDEAESPDTHTAEHEPLQDTQDLDDVVGQLVHSQNAPAIEDADVEAQAPQEDAQEPPIEDAPPEPQLVHLPRSKMESYCGAKGNFSLPQDSLLPPCRRCEDGQERFRASFRAKRAQTEPEPEPESKRKGWFGRR